MITQIIINALADFLIALVGWLPAFPEDVATSLEQLPSRIQGVTSGVAAFGVIIPWAQFATAAGIFLGLWLAGLAIRLGRMVLSLVTGGGGAV